MRPLFEHQELFVFGVSHSALIITDLRKATSGAFHADYFAKPVASLCASKRR